MYHAITYDRNLVRRLAFDPNLQFGPAVAEVSFRASVRIPTSGKLRRNCADERTRSRGMGARVAVGAFFDEVMRGSA